MLAGGKPRPCEDKSSQLSYFNLTPQSYFTPLQDWEDATFERLAKTTFEGAPDVTYHANPFYNDIKQNQYLKSA